MDNENTNIVLNYEPYPSFRHIDTRYDTRYAFTDNIYYDEFVDYDRIVDTFNSVQTGYTINANDIYVSFDHLWNETGQYELSFDGIGITIKQKEAPDFGELSPSQELNDFVNTLVQGE